MAALDIDLVHAFVLVAQLGSFTKAALALDTSQAAISVKIKRLEDRLGYRLLDRTPRNVRLSAHGMTFLKPAQNLISAHEQAVAGLSADVRRIAIGISDQIAGPELPAFLQKLNSFDPGLVVEVSIGSSLALMEAFHKEALDAAIVRREEDRRDGELLVRERFGWFAARIGIMSPDSPCGLHRYRELAVCGMQPPSCLRKKIFPGERFLLEEAWQRSVQQSLRVWRSHRWPIALLRSELSTSGLDMGFPASQIRMSSCIQRSLSRYPGRP